ncbi:hypothetical protein [uncultured Anoxybacillus sp.]|nr:hypothetical protein [uncultured Anoxybacillus sp.]
MGFTTVWTKDEVFVHVEVFWKKVNQQFLACLIDREGPFSRLPVEIVRSSLVGEHQFSLLIYFLRLECHNEVNRLFPAFQHGVVVRRFSL